MVEPPAFSVLISGLDSFCFRVQDKNTRFFEQCAPLQKKAVLLQ
jgi:hypothetical protein